MPDIEQFRSVLQDALKDVEGKYRGEIDALKAELEGFRNEREVQERRAAIYGGEMRSQEMSKDERRRYAVSLIGNTARAVAASRGDLTRAADIIQKHYRDERSAELLRSQIEGDFTLGGALVETDYSDEVIELLYAQAVVRRFVGDAMPMPNGNLTIPKVTSGVTASYVGEAQTIPATNIGTGQLVLSAKKLSALVPISNELLKDTSGRANRLVVADIGKQLSLREDLAFLRGDGTSDTPRGIRYAVASDNVLTGADTASLTLTLSNVRAKLRSANLGLSNVGLIMNAELESKFYNARDGAGSGAYLWRDEMDAGRLMGMRYAISNQIPSNISTDNTELYAGDFAEAIIGEASGVSFDTSSEASYWNGSAWVSAFATDQTVVRAISRHDFGLRHDTAFVVAQIDLGSVTTG